MFQFQVGYHLREEDPGAVRGRQDVGVLAEPSDAGTLGGGAVVHRPVVHEEAGVYRPADQFGQFAAESPQPRLDDVVIVAPPGVARHPAPGDFGVRRVVRGRAVVVAGGHGYYRARAFQQQFGTVHASDALLGVPGQAVHQPVSDALGGGALVPRERLGVGYAHAVESERPRQRLYLAFRISQISLPTLASV